MSGELGQVRTRDCILHLDLHLDCVVDPSSCATGLRHRGESRDRARPLQRPACGSFFPPTRAQAAAVARTRSRVVGAPRQGGSATRQRRCSGFGGCLRFLFLSLAFGQKLGAVWLAARQGGAPHQTTLYTMAEKRPKRKLLFWLETVVFGEDG